ncbi:MAG: NAD(P)H-binding protein [Armatimonadia bacterium]|nr:NAD(P)H-binding protein [Armatimonadia bacterium]
MAEQELCVVTGAFGYSGSHIARRLLDRGKRVRTITGRPDKDDPLQSKVEAHSFNFDNPGHLRKSLEGATTLYNTYWIRFEKGDMTFAKAVANSRVLIQAAVEAGVERIVHISIANPSEASYLPYFRGKAQVERTIRESGLSYAIVRPTVIFGGGKDILINNIAWMLRRAPVFGILGDGQYPIQPVHVGDLADICVKQGESRDRVTLDAVSVDLFTMEELMCTIAEGVGSYAALMRVPVPVGLFVTSIIGRIVGDVVLTRHEVEGLMEGLLYSEKPPLGPTSLRDWIFEHGDTLGREYYSEMATHYKKK